jgi:chaperonin GroES
MTQKLTPLHDRVLVRRVDEADTARGGIIIPDTAKEKPQEGIVIAAGTGKYEKGRTIPLAVKDGDRVLFGKYSGNEIKIDNEVLLILREEEVLGILTGSAKPARQPEAVGAGRK